MLRGEILVGELVMLAVERHYRDLQQAAARALRFNAAAAWHVIEFIERWHVHIKGDRAGQPILLEPFQRFWTAVKYGWQRNTGTAKAPRWLRRFTRAYERIARKNGKSTWIGPQGNYLWMMDGEVGAEVYAVATTRAQAMTVFSPAFENVKKWRRRSPGLLRSIGLFEGTNQERMTLGTSVFRPLASNADAQDGFNPSAVLFDELHAQRSREQLEVLESGFGARAQPLLSMITTAGYVQDGICVEQEEYLVRVLRGEIQDDSFFGYAYALDKDDDPFDERVWIKANPGLGTIKTWEHMRTQARKAAVLPSARVNFEVKDLNIWRNDAEGWLDLRVWDAGKRPFPLEQLRGRRCFGGLDLASVRDLTAFVLVFPPDDEDGEWFVLCWVWCPEAKLADEADDAAPYRKSAAAGWLTATPGDTTDYRPVKQAVVEASRLYQIESVGFDVWNATQLATELQDEGLLMVEIPQNTGGMYPGSKKLEALVYGKRLRHGGNLMLRHCAGNVALLFDTNGNFRPDKKRSRKGRIDPVVALVMALSRAVSNGDDGMDVSDYLRSPVVA